MAKFLTHGRIDMWALIAMCDQFEYSSVIRGHHVYKEIFTPTIGKTLQCRRESGNSHDLHAVATIENDAVVGHVPRNISVPCDLFLRKGGSISCVITGVHQYSNDLAQGGLEVPCKLVFNGPVKDISKLRSLLQRAPKLQEITGKIQTSNIAQTSSTVSNPNPTIKTDDIDSSSGKDEEKEDNPRKKVHIDGEGLLDVLEGKWLQIEKCILTPSDKRQQGDSLVINYT